MGITFVLWLMAIRLAPSSDRISNLVYIAPFLNLLLASQVLGEKIYLSTFLGIILLVAGILIQNTLDTQACREKVNKSYWGSIQAPHLMGYGVIKGSGKTPVFMDMGVVDLRRAKDHYMKLRMIYDENGSTDRSLSAR
jgi:hypothetical protein